MMAGRKTLRKTFANPGFTWQGSGALIEMRAISKVFHTSVGDLKVLNDINVDIHQGEFVSVVGRSGSGKSTLVNMLTGIDHPTSGTIRVGDTRLLSMSESRMSEWRGRNLGIVFQFFQLLPMLSLLENVMLPMDLANLYDPAERETRALVLLERVGLGSLKHKLPGAVSGGQQQSAAIARSLANDPPIIVADEPTGNLDSRSAEAVILLFEELVAQGKTILMVTHDSTLARRTSRTLLLSDGEMIHPAIARAFPDLPHTRLLTFTRQAQPRIAKDGDLIAAAGAGETPVFVIQTGEVGITVPGKPTPKGPIPILARIRRKPDRPVSAQPDPTGTNLAKRLCAGQAFSPASLLKDFGPHSEAHAAGAVELLVI
jgi:putative ABC transport system ATP-binding protein